MQDDDQSVVPRSFVELFLPPGKVKPTESRAFIATRHDFCEDLALSLVAHPLVHRGDDRPEVLARIRDGLAGDDAPLSPVEADWVVKRLDELLTHGVP